MTTASPPPAFLFLTRTVARVLFALPFIASGLFHFIKASEMAPAVPIPGGVVWVYVTGAGLLAGGLGVLFRWLGMWGALGLALLLILFILTVHLPALGNPAMRQMAMAGVLKDTGLLGGALTWAGILASNEQ
ncbi:MAG TPA: DoxX family membrane protein [Kofleriaceae bacterium]|nr:DoxX family membrane protein [Kofleriaceae bacterium]